MTGSCRLLILFLTLTACFTCSSPRDEAKEPKNVGVEEPVGEAGAGRALYAATCKSCHGDFGQGNQKLKAPALANTDSWYVYRQLSNFRKGIRGSHPSDTLGAQMAAFVSTLKDTTAISHLTAFIESMPEAPLRKTIAGDIKKGERTYQSICGSCHGPQGKGNKAMNAPRLNGLDDWYLKSQILKFRSSIRGTHAKDIYGAQMIPMAALLKDDHSINDVIAYIRSVTVSPQ